QVPILSDHLKHQREQQSIPIPQLQDGNVQLEPQTQQPTRPVTASLTQVPVHAQQRLSGRRSQRTCRALVATVPEQSGSHHPERMTAPVLALVRVAYCLPLLRYFRCCLIFLSP